MSSCSLHICSCSSLITFRTDCRKEERGEKSTQRQSALTRGTPWESRPEGRKCAAGHPGVTVHDHLLSSQEPKDAVFSLTCPIRRPVLQFEQPPTNAFVPYWGPSLPVRVRDAESSNSRDGRTCGHTPSTHTNSFPKHANTWVPGTCSTQHVHRAPTLSTPSRPTPQLTPLKPQEHFGLLCQLQKNTATFRIHTYLVLNLLH